MRSRNAAEQCGCEMRPTMAVALTFPAAVTAGNRFRYRCARRRGEEVTYRTGRLVKGCPPAPAALRALVQGPVVGRRAGAARPPVVLPRPGPACCSVAPAGRAETRAAYRIEGKKAS
ncbi:hypothetical protein FMEAI12_6500047 [Parafrankia sp. Ea1.12]|nr:hypothetical protein FMEAI12_6500047 [Parafrankia sp. Ea1.12]